MLGGGGGLVQNGEGGGLIQNGGFFGIHHTHQEPNSGGIETQTQQMEQMATEAKSLHNTPSNRANHSAGKK